MMEKYFFVKNEDEIKKFEGNKIVGVFKIVKKTENGFLTENNTEIICPQNINENSFIRVFGKVENGKIIAEVVHVVENIFKDLCTLYYEVGSW